MKAILFALVGAVLLVIFAIEILILRHGGRR